MKLIDLIEALADGEPHLSMDLAAKFSTELMNVGSVAAQGSRRGLVAKSERKMGDGKVALYALTPLGKKVLAKPKLLDAMTTDGMILSLMGWMASGNQEIHVAPGYPWVRTLKLKDGQKFFDKLHQRSAKHLHEQGMLAEVRTEPDQHGMRTFCVLNAFGKEVHELSRTFVDAKRAPKFSKPYKPRRVKKKA